MQNLKLLIGVIGGTLVLVMAVAFLFSNDQEASEPTLADASLLEGERRHVKLSSSADTDASQEDEAADDATPSSESEAELVTIVEFSDLQCPACRTAEPIVEQVIANNPGRIELIYRHFPLDQSHPYAREAAIASEVVAEQGLFFEYINLLFEEQPTWSQSDDPTPLFIEYAQQVGADVTDFETKLGENQYADLVEADVRDGFALGVNATPTFFVDGEKVNATGLAAAVAERL